MSNSEPELRIIKITGKLIREQWYLERGGRGIELTDALFNDLDRTQGVNIRIEGIDQKPEQDYHAEIITIWKPLKAKGKKK